LLGFFAAGCWAVAIQNAAAAFEYPDVVRRAQALAKQPFEEPKDDLPKPLRSLTYDQYRDIRFRPERSLWRAEGLPFEVQLFHRGFYFNRTVAINVIEPEGVKPVPFATEWFDYGHNNFGQGFPPDLGYAGFRLHYPINRADYRDEVAAFLGASYFRAIGKGQGYGLSARGLAIDTGEATGEEFPYFKEYWLRKPARNAKQVIVYALLDSRSASGAYQFIVQPGDATVVGVTATLFLRRKVAKFGIAPLTSMFYYGENTVRDIISQRPLDFRPEVHDSDGLLIHAGSGEWIWRPLINPLRLKVNTFETAHPRGFGLMQRDRGFDHYQDLEARFERRPSAWVATRGDWGEGRIELIQIPSDDEKNDNIAAFWVAKTPPVPGKAVQLAYDLRWSANESYPVGGRTDATRVYLSPDTKARIFVLDFVEGQLAKLPPDDPPEAVLSVSSNGAAIAGQRLEKNAVTKGWRVTFQIPAKTDGPLELRAFLKKGQDVLTETWSYLTEP
jgi:glucans biosynthesis protein